MNSRHRQKLFSTPRALAIATLAIAMSPAFAAVFTVGPGGTHSTIQAALDAAVAVGPGEHEVRIARGTWSENLTLAGGATPLELVIRGGYGPEFTIPTSDPRLTEIDGGGVGRALTVGRRESGRLRIEGLTLKGGRAGDPAPRGGDLDLEAGGTMVVELDSVRIVDGVAISDSTTGDASGGGLAARLLGGARLELRLVQFEGNRVEVSAGVGRRANGGGASFELFESSELSLLGLEFLSNRSVLASPVVSGNGGGLFLAAHDDSRAEVDGLEIIDNRAPDLAAIGAFLAALDRSEVAAHSILAYGNRAASSFQLAFLSANDARMRIGEVVVSDADSGIVGGQGQRAALQLTGLTVTRHDGTGAYFATDPASPDLLSVHNSIFWNNGSNLELEPGVVAGANLVGVDPRFVDDAGDNFNLAAGSPGIDAGENFPPGGLWGTDFTGAPRVQGSRVDIGAYETENPPPHGGGEGPVCRILDPDPGPGHSSGTLIVPIPLWTNVCLCLGDYGLNEMSCSFRLRNLQIVARFPRFFAPGKALPVRWAIHPWAPVAGPYELRASAEIDGEWLPQQWLGPVAGKLKLDQVIVEPFQVQTAFKGRTPLRTTIVYLDAEGNWRKPELELLLPSPVPPPK